jgi:phage-related protein
MEPHKKIAVVFYRTAAGNEPVRDWLKDLDSAEKKTIGTDIKAVELNWPVGLPLVRKLEADLWEVRSMLPNRIARVFFTVWGGLMILVHGFIKKGQKTPKGDIDLARKRCKEVQQGGIEP